MEQSGQRLQTVDQAGARTVDGIGVDSVDTVDLDGGDALPAGPSLDGFRRCAGVRHDDHFRVRLDDCVQG